MKDICPISFQRINEKVARINGLITATLSVVYILFGWKWIPLFLFADFFMRGFEDAKYSLIARISKVIAQGLKLKPKMVNAGPKSFAAQIGAVLTGVAATGLYFNAEVVALVCLLPLALFSFLEGAFGFCVACKIYPFIRKYSPESYDVGL